MTEKRQKKSFRETWESFSTNQKWGIGLIPMLLLVFIFGGIMLAIYTLPTDEDYSPISLISSRDGEVVSWVNIEIWSAKVDATFDAFSDINTGSNWELSEEGAAEDLRVDLTLHTFGIWIRIDDSLGYFEESWFHISAGEEQFDITIYINHRPSNVLFTNLNSTFREGLPTNNTEESYTLVTKFPTNSNNELHFKDENLVISYMNNAPEVPMIYVGNNDLNCLSPPKSHICNRISFSLMVTCF